MKTIASLILLGLLSLSGFGAWAEEVKLETLLKSQLANVEGTEIIVSKVQIPPDTSLPKHWHPGEEFAYVLAGRVILWQEGESDISMVEGEAMQVPLEKVHTAITGPEGVTLLVFRVHEKGKPERVLAEGSDK